MQPDDQSIDEPADVAPSPEEAPASASLDAGVPAAKHVLPPPPRPKPKATYPSLDKTKKHSQIRGVLGGARYMQNGHYFGGNGNYLRSDKGYEPPTALKPAAPVPKLDRSARARQGDVNLQAWADGKEQHIWAKIQVSVESATGTRPQNKLKALELLRTHGVIDNDELDNTDGT